MWAVALDSRLGGSQPWRSPGGGSRLMTDKEKVLSDFWETHACIKQRQDTKGEEKPNQRSGKHPLSGTKSSELTVGQV